MCSWLACFGCLCIPLLSGLISACGGTSAGGSSGERTVTESPSESWNWSNLLPEGIPPPTVPVDNPMNASKVELGRHLFYDARLSENGTQSCGTCHDQALAF